MGRHIWHTWSVWVTNVGFLRHANLAPHLLAKELDVCNPHVHVISAVAAETNENIIVL